MKAAYSSKLITIDVPILCVYIPAIDCQMKRNHIILLIRSFASFNNFLFDFGKYSIIKKYAYKNENFHFYWRKVLKFTIFKCSINKALVLIAGSYFKLQTFLNESVEQHHFWIDFRWMFKCRMINESELTKMLIQCCESSELVLSQVVPWHVGNVCIPLPMS